MHNKKDLLKNSLKKKTVRFHLSGFLFENTFAVVDVSITKSTPTISVKYCLRGAIRLISEVGLVKGTIPKTRGDVAALLASSTANIDLLNKAQKTKKDK